MTKTRLTNQRIKILEYLKSTKEHPGAEKVYINVKKNLTAITLATVYRNLNLLADRGEILRLEVNGEYRYDADRSSHQHMICRTCGKIMDIYEDVDIKKLLRNVKLSNFNVDCVTVEIYGTCKEEKK